MSFRRRVAFIVFNTTTRGRTDVVLGFTRVPSTVSETDAGAGTSTDGKKKVVDEVSRDLFLVRSFCDFRGRTFIELYELCAKVRSANGAHKMKAREITCDKSASLKIFIFAVLLILASDHIPAQQTSKIRRMTAYESWLTPLNIEASVSLRWSRNAALTKVGAVVSTKERMKRM